MLGNIVLLQHGGLCAGLLCAAQLSAQALFYHYFHCFITFLGIQISVTALDAPGEKWCLPPPSSFNLMNCLFSYQRVMSTKPHNIYSWNKRQRDGGGGSRSHSWVWRGEKLDVLKELFLLISSDTGFCVQEKPTFPSSHLQASPKSMLRDPVAKSSQ